MELLLWAHFYDLKITFQHFLMSGAVTGQHWLTRSGPIIKKKTWNCKFFSCERWLLRSTLSSKLLNNDSYIWEFFGMWFVFNFLLLWKISNWGKSTERIQNDLPLGILWTQLQSLPTQSPAHCIHGPAHSTRLLSTGPRKQLFWSEFQTPRRYICNDFTACVGKRLFLKQ